LGRVDLVATIAVAVLPLALLLVGIVTDWWSVTLIGEGILAVTVLIMLVRAGPGLDAGSLSRRD
jgi:hypothetical protein